MHISYPLTEFLICYGMIEKIQCLINRDFLPFSEQSNNS